jgi:hypothetical protein
VTVHNIPLKFTIKEDDHNGDLRLTEILVNTNPCALTASDVNGLIKWKFDRTYTFYITIESYNQAMSTKTVTIKDCESYYNTPEDKQKYCRTKKFIPAPGPPQNVTTCLQQRHDNKMDVLVKWLPSKSRAPIVSSNVDVSYKKTQDSYTEIFEPEFSVHGNATSFTVRSLDASYELYCVAITSSIDHHLAAPYKYRSLPTNACFSNYTIQLCDPPEKVFVTLPESSGYLIYVEEICIPTAVLIIVLVIIMSAVCVYKSRPPRYRVLSELCMHVLFIGSIIA